MVCQLHGRDTCPMRTSEDRSGPLVTCIGNLCQSKGTSSPVSTGDIPVLPVQVTNGPDRSSELLIPLQYLVFLHVLTIQILQQENGAVTPENAPRENDRVIFAYGWPTTLHGEPTE